MSAKFYLFILQILLSFYSHAQLAGDYTIGPASKYKTFNDALYALTNDGIASHVTFNVEPGTYIEQLSFPALATSATKMVLFQSANGDSSSVILKFKPTDDSSNFTIQFNETEYVLFRKITIATDTGFGHAIVFTNGCSYIQFLSNRIMGVPHGSELVYSDNSSSSIDNHNFFARNHFIFGSIGISFQGNSVNYEDNNVINENYFTDQDECAISLLYENNIQVIKNVIITNSASQSVCGINCSHCTGGFVLEKNKISLENPGMNSIGIRIFMCGGTTLAHNLVANNFIHIHTSDFAYGIQSISPNMDYFHNSVNITGNYNGSIAFGIVSGTGISVINNIFSNPAGGYALLISDTLGITSHHNNLFSSGPVLAARDMTDYPDIDSLNHDTRLEKFSVSIAPGFITNSDLHTKSPLFDNMGTALIRISDDIDGQTRSMITPDLGADEFTGSFELGTEKYLCENDSVVLDPGSGFETYLWSDNSKNQKLTASKKNFGLGTFNIKVRATYKSQIFNDSVIIHIIPDPVLNLGSDRDICKNGFAWFLAPDSFSYLWSTGDTTRSLVVEVKDTAEYWLAIISKIGCKAIDTVKVNAIPIPEIELGKDTMLCADRSVILDAGPGMDSYLWSGNSTGRTITVDTSGRGTGKFRFKVTVSKLSCTNSDSIDITFIICTPIEKTPENGFLIYPVPAEDHLNVLLPVYILQSSYSIKDVAGKILDSNFLGGLNSEVLLNNLPEGIYIFSVEIPGRSVLSKLFMIQKR